jgi:hypothetical protein
LAITIVPKVMCSSIRSAFNCLECGTNNNMRCAEVRKNRTLATEDVRKMIRIAFCGILSNALFRPMKALTATASYTLMAVRIWLSAPFWNGWASLERMQLQHLRTNISSHR